LIIKQGSGGLKLRWIKSTCAHPSWTAEVSEWGDGHYSWRVGKTEKSETVGAVCWLPNGKKTGSPGQM